jgi:hypothetical protein
LGKAHHDHSSTTRARIFMDSQTNRSGGQQASEISPSDEQTSELQNQSVASVIPAATQKILKLRVSGSQHLVYFVQWKPASTSMNKE